MITFASFEYPFHIAMLPAKPLRQRLEEYKRDKSRSGGYFKTEPCPNNQSRFFYLDSDFMPGLRWKYCDVISARYLGKISHRGWFTDEYGDGDKIRGIVMRLPHGKGFLAGWTMGENMISVIEYDEIFDDECRAAHVADSLAKHAAEEEREYDVRCRQEEDEECEDE